MLAYDSLHFQAHSLLASRNLFRFRSFTGGRYGKVGDRAAPDPKIQRLAGTDFSVEDSGEWTPRAAAPKSETRTLDS